MSKSPEQVDAIMARIDERSRYRWCGAEKGPCACLGCVQICSRSLMYEKTFAREHRGDPEYLDERRFPPVIRERYGVTREEWEAWKERHPDPNPPQGHYGITAVSGEPVQVGALPDKPMPAGDYTQVSFVTFRGPADIPIPDVAEWSVKAARQVQAKMYDGDWTVETIAKLIHETYERKDSTP